MLNQFQPFLDLSQTIPSEIRVAVVAQPVSTEKKNWGIPSEIRVAVVAQPVSTKKKFGYTFENQGCSGCSTSFNHSWISPKLYLWKSGLQWLLNRFQPKKKLGYTFGNHGCSGCSTGFNQSWISPKLYLQKSGLQGCKVERLKG